MSDTIEHIEAPDLGSPLPVPWGPDSSIEEGVQLLEHIRTLAHQEDGIHEKIQALEAEDDSLWRSLRRGAGDGLYEPRQADQWRARRNEIAEELDALRSKAEDLAEERERFVRRLQRGWVLMRGVSWSHLPPPEPRKSP